MRDFTAVLLDGHELGAIMDLVLPFVLCGCSMTSEVLASRRVEIRKYPNRCYYDVTHRRHLCLEGIHTLVWDGFDIRVTESESGEDITAKVLTQIIFELGSPSSRPSRRPVAPGDPRQRAVGPGLHRKVL